MRGFATLYWAAFATLVLDQLTKYLVVHIMNLREELWIDVWPPFIQFRMAWNEGINFGIPLGGPAVLITLSLVICGFIIRWMARERPGFWGFLAAGVLVGGAIGNVVDRLIFGAVADFLNMSCCGWVSPWSFNVADIAIFVGAIGLIFLTGKDSKQDQSGLS